MNPVRPLWSRLLAVSASAIMLAGVVPLGFPSPVAAAELPAPALTSPVSDSTVTGNPVFAWNAVAGATKYRIEVSASSSMSPTLVADETPTLRYTPIAELPLGVLYWRVAARDSTNVLGTYANASFTKEWNTAPNQLTPAASATLSFPTDPLLFTWAALSGAQSYELQVDDADDFIGATTYATKNTSYVVTEPKTNGQQFYWRVRAVSSAVYSNWSSARQFSVQWPSIPNLLSPADGATLTDVQLDWSPVLGAKTYQLQVSPNPDFANNVPIDVIVKGTRYAPPITLNNGAYYWRVRAKDAAGVQNNGGWSDPPRIFHRSWSERPVLLGPANGDQGLAVPTLSWTPVAHAAYYEVQWSTDPNFLEENVRPPNGDICYTNRTTVTPYGVPGIFPSDPGPGCSLDPLPGVTYFWHVRGIDPPVLNTSTGEPGVLGAWSNSTDTDTWSFVYMPASPALVSPQNGADLDVPTLDWSDASGATKYKVTIIKADDQVAVQTDTYSTSWTPAVALKAADGPFSWYVQSYDYASHLSVIPAPISWRWFNVVASGPTFASPEPTSPADNASSVEMPPMTWQPVTGADRYQVWYSTDNHVFRVLGPVTHYPATTYTQSVVTPSTYYWYVQAFNLLGTQISVSGTSRFVVSQPDLLGTADYLTPSRCVGGVGCSAIADTPTLRWNPVPGVLWYRVYVAQDPSFTNIYRGYDTTFTELTPRSSYVDSQASGSFYWFVRPIRSDNSGRFDSVAQANASAFQKRSEPIHLVTPLANAEVPNQVTFQWVDFLAANQSLTPPVTQEAKQYRITISTVSDFASVLDTIVVDQPFYTPFVKTYPEGPIYWKVQAIDGSNNNLTSSGSWLLQKNSPRVTLIYPANASTQSGVPYLQWAPQAYAAQYDVQLDNDSNFSSPVATATTKMSAWAYADALSAGTYYWRVRRKDADNLDGPWSATRSFSLAPAAPALTSPANTAVTPPSTLVLRWTSTQPAPKYTVELSTSNTFSVMLGGAPRTTVMTQWAPSALLANGTYYWRVKALNASGAILATSSTWSFVVNVDTTHPVVSSMSPASAAAITSSFTATFSEPVLAVTATSFVVKAAGASSALAGSVTMPTSTTATFTPAATLVPGQTYAVSLTNAITDLNGNSLTPYSKNIRTAITVEQGSPAVHEAWARWTTAFASGGAMKVARTPSALLTFKFTGAAVSVVGFRGPSGGNAKVTVDGVVKASALSFYSATNQYKTTVLPITGLTGGSHTLQITPLGTKLAAAKDTWVYVDAFLVNTTTFEDNSSAVTDRFHTVTTASASGGSFEVMGHVAKIGWSTPTLTFQFAGTGVTWFGTKAASYGKATVYIDGVSKGTVDLYSSTTKYKQTIWTSATLTNALHTFKVVVAGTKQTASKGYDVSFDYFTVK
jgi:hypothetical protein